MVTALPALLMELTLHQTPSGTTPTSAVSCPVIEHVDLSRTSSLVGREVCVSPGLLTGFVFDLPADVEIQDETRFLNLSRSRDAISFRPPGNMAAGERLRLTVRLGEKESRQEASFLLVAHPGQATHQVQVYHDTRTRESLLQEIDQERVSNQQLQEDNQQLRRQVEQARALYSQLTGLSGAYLIGALEQSGIRALKLSLSDSAGVVMTSTATSYRSWNQVALDLFVQNEGDDPWMAVGASLVDATGRKLEGVRLTQTAPARRGALAHVFVEVEANPEELQGKHTLTVWEAGPRTISTHQIVFPR